MPLSNFRNIALKWCAVNWMREDLFFENIWNYSSLGDERLSFWTLHSIPCELIIKTQVGYKWVSWSVFWSFSHGSYIWCYLGHFSAQAWKTLKKCFGKWNCLYFLKKKSFSLYFRKWDFLVLKLKNFR